MKTCNTCKQSKSNKSFTVNNARPDNLDSRCRECMSIIRKKKYSDNTAYYKLQWKRNKYSKSENAEDRRLKSAYGINTKVRNFIIQKAGNHCEICNNATQLVIDHDHITGIIRGILCSKCNRGLGHFNDDASILQLATDYLLSKYNESVVDFK